jgi:hypothetical protein
VCSKRASNSAGAAQGFHQLYTMGFVLAALAVRLAVDERATASPQRQ